MDTWDGSAFIGYIFGALVGALILYVVIRLAVTHAIRAARPQTTEQAPSTRAQPLSHLDQDGV